MTSEEREENIILSGEGRAVTSEESEENISCLKKESSDQ